MNKLGKDGFVIKANLKHNNRYNYDSVLYINNQTKVDIFCREHGLFKQSPNAHMSGQGCPKCMNGIKYTQDEFLFKANKVHNNFYNYDSVIYNNSYEYINIICPVHGIFKQMVNNHLSGQGCPKCKGKGLSTDDCIKMFNDKHNFKYDYSKVKYELQDKEVQIICPTHGVFYQTPKNHLRSKNGCPDCSNVKISNTTDFIKKSVKIHDNIYDYKDVNYINAKSNVNIICKIHGSFYQQPTKHLSGQGCPICKLSKGELYIYKYLKNINISFKRQYKFENLNLVFDFYLPDYNLCIEYDGIQHFKPINYFGGKKSYIEQINRDKIKNQYCTDNNIILYRIPYYKIISEELSKLSKLYFFNT